MQPDVDECYTIRNNFLIGNYQAAINEALRMEPSLDRDIVLYRSYIAQDPITAVAEIRGMQPEIAVVREAARFFSAKENDRSSLVEAVCSFMDSFEASAKPIVQLMVAEVLVADGQIDRALRILRNCPLLEAKCLAVQVYIQMNQLDYADKELSQMMSLDGVATETTLAGAWLAVAQKSPRLSETVDVLGEIMEKWAPTPYLLNIVAAAHLVQGDYALAESVLLQALEANPRHPDTLANLLVTSRHLQRPSASIARYQRQLKEVDPIHPCLVRTESAMASFQELSSGFQ